MRKLLTLAIITASLLIIMNTFALAQVYLPGPGIYLSVTPSAKSVTTGTTVTFHITAYDIDAYGDPLDIYDSLGFEFTGPDVPTPTPIPGHMLPEEPYTCTFNVTYSIKGQYEFTVRAYDAGSYANDPDDAMVTVRIAAGDVAMPDGVICVSPTGLDSNYGLNWSFPKQTIQAAVNAAQPNGEIWVAEGDYNCSPSCIVINKDLMLYGGFTGNETQRNPRDLKNNVTAITSTTTAPYAMFVSPPTDSYGNPIGSYINFTLDGFTFNNCSHGGLSVSFATANIANNTFKNCSGGGLLLRQCTNTSITGNMIVDNHAEKGGGVYLAGTSSGLAINNNTIVNNEATVDGGGIYAEMMVSGTVKNNIIASNTGSGIKQELSTTPLSLSKNCVNGNTPDNYMEVSHPTDINLPPLLTADYHLTSSSPCVDVGVTVPAYNNSDVDGDSRVMDGDWDESEVIDIGADEYQDITPPIVTINTEITKDQSVSTITLFGTALDKESGVETVTVRINAEPATSASYDPVTKVWTVTWNTPPPGSQTVQVHVKATDKAGNISDEVDETVTVTDVPVIYVDGSSGALDDNGTSWQSPKKTVTDAINSATDGTEIWVADGTYSENVALIKDQYQDKSGVSLYGGFAGADSSSTYVGETAREQRNWAVQQTILDGSVNQSSVVLLWCASDVIIDGFVIQNGRGFGGQGGGIYCVAATNSTIKNNVIRWNDVAQEGGGLCAAISTLNLNVVGNVFLNNTSSNGGAISFIDDSCGYIANNTIIKNKATGDGGGIYMTPNTLVFANNIIACNIGGGIYSTNSNPVYQGNAVCNNAKYNYYGMPVPQEDRAITDPGIPNISIGDWHISESSQCKDHGVYDPEKEAVIGHSDIDSMLRKSGAIDIGADEWNGTDPVLVNPNIIRVQPNGNDGNNGSGWDITHAVATVQKGIDLLGDAGGEVWVAAGTYNEKITLKSFVKVYGGFVINGDKTTRNWSTNTTALDGGGAGNVVKIENAVECSVDGFKIRNGNRGIYVDNASCTIIHNTIEDNILLDGTGAGIYCNQATGTMANNFILFNRNSLTRSGGGLYLSNSSMSVLNNTIAKNKAGTAGGVYISGGYPDITNNIVALNSSGIYISGTIPAPMNNDVWQNTADTAFYWKPACNPEDLPDQNGNIIKDPKFVDVEGRNLHVFWGSGCRDAGLDTCVIPVDSDIDKETRKNGRIDIGADETTLCYRYQLRLTSEQVSLPINAEARVIASVVDGVDNQAEAGYRVDISVDSGEVVSVTRGTQVVDWPQGTGTQSTYGVTGTDGKVEILVTSQNPGFVHVNGTLTQCDMVFSESMRIRFFDPAIQYRVGFIYDLCDPVPLFDGTTVRSFVDQYLTRIGNAYTNITYDKIMSRPFTIDESFNTVFIVLPTDGLQSTEIAELNNFVQSGRNKRVVLVGEFNTGYSQHNTILNNIASALGMTSRFATSSGIYDEYPNRERLCKINSSHYLMESVDALWDSAAGVFPDGWEANAESLAFTNAAPLYSWILEEDTAGAGSRILIHDASIMIMDYNNEEGYSPPRDIIPDKNFKFIINLCAIFPK